MFKGLRGRFLVIAAVILGCLWSLRGFITPDPEDRPIQLGLDLAGGSYFVLEVSDPEGTMAPEAKLDAIDRALEVIRNRIDQFGVREPTVQKVGDHRIVVELPGVPDPERAKAIIEQTAFLEFKIVTDPRPLLDILPRLDSVIVASLPPESLQAVAPPEPEMPGGIFQELDTAGGEARTPATPTRRPLTSLLLQSGEEGILLVELQKEEIVQRFLELPEVRRRLPSRIDLVWAADTVGQAGQLYRSLYVLEREPMVTGDYLIDAQANRDPTYARPIVQFTLTRQGGRIFERGTSQHVGDRMAIILDGKVQGSPPVIRSAIRESGQIELSTAASMEEARDLALVLRAGALPAPLEIVEERSVGPSLGNDSIRQGRRAGLIGVALVVLMMLGYYRLSGALAIAALGVYVLLILGLFAGFGATLTLPGLAGLVLSVGMAVDANVLVFERIREELAAGKTVRLATEEGFNNALSAIIDSNLTTLITGLVLFQFGTGPVKGFAVMLCVGIVASFFSAVYVTRTLMLWYLERRPATAPLSI
ncbi:MAG: protein translocase subunit SecD [Gemmatimonadota bacterium]